LASSTPRKEEKREANPQTGCCATEEQPDCRFCCEEKDKRTEGKREMPVSWQMRKGRGGRELKINTVKNEKRKRHW
jgi:hypothetical protein